MNNWFKNLQDAGLTGYAILDIPLLILAAIVYPFVESARWLTRQAYFTNWEGYFFRLPAGIALSLAGAIYSGYYMGWVQSSSTWLWLLSGFAGWLSTWFYIWPAICVAWLKIVKPYIWEPVHKTLRKYSGPAFKGTVKVLSKVMPGSTAVWKKVNEKHAGHSWASNLIGALAVLGTAAFAWKVAMAAYVCTLAAVGTLGLLGWMLSIGAWITVFSLVCGVVWEMLDGGDLEAVAIAGAAGSCVAFGPELFALGSAFGLAGNLAYIATAAAFVLSVTYVFPLVYMILSGGFVKWLLDQLKPLNDNAYNDKSPEYKLFFAHIVNLVFACGLGYGAYLVSLSLGLALPYTIAIVVLVGLLSYVEAYDEVGSYAASGAIGFFGAGYTAWTVGTFYVAQGFAGGAWVAVPVGILSGLLWAGVLYPFAYLVSKGLFYYPGVALSQPLDSLYKGARGAYKKLSAELLQAYDSSYRDRSGYQVWFLHAANIALSVSAYFGSSLLAAQLGLGTIGTIILVAVAVYVTYNLMGEFLLSWKGGVAFIGFVTSLAAAIWTGALLSGHGYSWVILLICASTAASLTGWIFFPLAYIIARLVARPVLASWSTGILTKLHELSWSSFVVFWDAFVATYRWLAKLLRPFWSLIATAMIKIAEAYQVLRNKLGRRS